MRMWNVPTKLLCRQHLLGEHYETHMFVGTINKNKSVDGYIKKGLLEVHNIKKRHEELVKEMEVRGMNHKSPLPKYKIIELGNVDIEENLKELRKRCKNCRRLQNE